MKRFSFILLFLSILFLSYSCETTPEQEYRKREAKELASGVRNDSLFLGLYLGMTMDDFYARCWEMNKMGLIMNSNLQPSSEEPIRLYINDFDKNLSKDPILTYYRQGKEYPIAGFDELSTQLVMLKKRFRQYSKFANSSLDQIFTEEELNASIKRKVDFFYSVIVWNEGGSFRMEKLPDAAQYAPIHSILIQQAESNEPAEIWLGGNLYDIQPSIGRLDGNQGLRLIAKKEGERIVYESQQLGWKGQLRDIKLLKANGQSYLLLGRNDEALQVYKLREEHEEL